MSTRRMGPAQLDTMTDQGVVQSNRPWDLEQ
jgi:hypothetical protein